jgi:hypothetical protein
MSDKNICFLHITVNNNNEHHISMDINVEKKKLYCYERLKSIEYELGHIDPTDIEYKIDKKSKLILVKPRCAYFTENHELHCEKGIDPEKILLKLVKQLKNINIIICNNARFTLNSLFVESVRYNIQLDLNKFYIVDLEINDLELNSVKKIKDKFFELYKKN